MFQKNDAHRQTTFLSDLNDLPRPLKKRLKNSWSEAFYHNVFAHIDEEVYAVLYADEPSRPNVPVNILVGLEILKAGFGWSDEEMYDNACYNVQVRHALGLRMLGEGYFSLRTVYVFRQRLVTHMQETGKNLLDHTFEQITQEQLATFRLKTEHQRLDSTQIASNIREMSRLQLLVEVLQRVHRMLTEADQAQWAAEFAPYLQGTSGQYTHHLKGEGAHRPHLEAIGHLMARLVSDLAADYQTHETYQTLCRVFEEHFTANDDDIAPKDGSDLKASNLQSPDDPTATYRRKGQEGYVGYVANVTETCHRENDFQLILNVLLEANRVDDAQMLADILPELKEKYDLKRMNADGGYGSPTVDALLAKHKVLLHQTALRGRNPAPDAFNLADYQLEIDPEERTLRKVTAPDGTAWQVDPGRKAGRYILYAPPPAGEKPVKQYVGQEDVERALRRQRSREPNPDGKNPRAAIEATIGAIKRPFKRDKLPVRGKCRMTMMVIGGAVMVNLRRIQRFQAEKRKEARKKMAECGARGVLCPFFNPRLIAFLRQFFTPSRFSLLHR